MDSRAFYHQSSITSHAKDTVTNLVVDTLLKNKQALVFVNSKRSAESVAKKLTTFLRKKKTEIGLTHHLPEHTATLQRISEQAIQETQTKQCLTLAACLKEGIAFHHAGLTAHQRSLVEQQFRAGIIKVICCTPTLAIGMDLPAYRVIIRDVKRFTATGMNFIPTLEYEQIAGRAGRPGKETEGEAIIIASNQGQHDEVIERYIDGNIENIYSKLAVEPVFRTYLLSLIASGFVRSRAECIDFFSQTFWSHQYQDPHRLTAIIDHMLDLLEDFGFIQRDGKNKEQATDEFSSAAHLLDQSGSPDQKIRATTIGKRVSELYIDPLSANTIIHALKFRMTNGKDLTQQSAEPLEIPLNKAAQDVSPVKVRTKDDFIPHVFSWLHLFSMLIEMRPLLRIRTADMEFLDQSLVTHEEYLLYPIPSQFEFEYEDFMMATKTALFLEDWISEKDEEYLLEKYNVRPGETRIKLDILDWLLYTTTELNQLLGYTPVRKEITHLRERVKYGVREELLNLLRLKGIGRVRARMLFSHNVKTVQDVKATTFERLSSIVGKGIAQKIKKQLDQEVPDTPSEPTPTQKSFNPEDLSQY